MLACMIWENLGRLRDFMFVADVFLKLAFMLVFVGPDKSHPHALEIRTYAQGALSAFLPLYLVFNALVSCLQAMAR